ncbi:hypothetical protein GVN24_28710 [Rhizobium sp. CRIBSB]|nr:hypothetical protein [Rhizobium sp. CRIBSB]
MTWWIVAAVVAAVLWFGVGKRIWAEFTLGSHLVRMTNAYERALASGDPSYRPSLEDGLALERGIAYLRTLPRHVVTRELLKNTVVAANLGREQRVAAMRLLFVTLVDEGVALRAGEFAASYGH